MFISHKKHPSFVIPFIAVLFTSLIFLQITTIHQPIINDSSINYETKQVEQLIGKPDLSTQQASPISYMEITVFDAITSLPIGAASVDVKDEITGATIFTGSTNEQSFVNVTDIYVGYFKIVVSKTTPSLYRTEEYFRRIDILGEIVKVNSYLTPESKINGVIETEILDITGNSIPSVFVDIFNEDRSLITRCSTNETGFAVTSVPLVVGTYIVNAKMAGYYSKNTTVTLEWYGEYKKVSIVLLPKGTASAFIEITSKDAISKNNLSYVHIEIFNFLGTSIWTGMTDENGYFVVSDLDMGYHRITAYRDLYNKAEKVVNLHHPADYDRAPFSLYPTSSNYGYIELYTKTEKLVNISSASVYLYDQENQLVKTGMTDDLGFYNITSLAEGNYFLKVSADTFLVYTQEITIRWNADHKKQEIILTGQNEVGTLEVEFLDDSGTPLSSVLVKLLDTNGNITTSAWTDKGRLTISELQLEKYTLEATKKGFQKFKTEFDLLRSQYYEISETLLPNKGTGSFDVSTPLNAYILVKNTNGEVVFSGESESGETMVSGLPIGDYSVSMFTEFGSQSVIQSIVWNGYNAGLFLQDLIDITDNSSCMEITMWDIDIGLVEDVRVDVITQNGYSFFGHTDVNGFVNITGLFLGEYDVVCHKYGYRDTEVTSRIEYTGQKKISNLYIYKAYGNVHVHITEAYSGDPYPAYVRYKPQFFGDWTNLVRADLNGYIGFHNLPVGYYNFSVMSGAYETQYAHAYINFDGDMVHLNFELIYPGGDGQIDFYALIVAGGDEQRFTHDAYNMFKTLTLYYGFYLPNVFLLTPHATDSVSGQTVPRDAVTSVLQVEWAINQIAMMSDADDQVVIWWTGHGGFMVGPNDVIIEGQFQTHADAIGAPHFDTLLDGILCKYMYIFLGPCHSGYWINDLNDEPNRAIYTSCRWDEVGWATDDHSYWPWATRKALDPSLSASSADDDSNGKVSLYELYEWADHWVRVSQDKNQHPQRFVGQGVSYGNDLYRYLGDGTYSVPLAGRSSSQFSEFQVKSSLQTYPSNNAHIDESTGIAIIPRTGVIDSLWDDSDISFEVYNATRFPDHIPVSNIQIIIRDIYGSILASGYNNDDGFITFYDFPEGIYAWEAVYGDLIIISGQICIQQAQAVTYAYSDNFDYQGDEADIKIQIEESKKGINLENVIVELYHANGDYIASQASNFNGEVLFLDVEDGLYGYRVTHDANIIGDGNIYAKTSTFTLETDSTSPEIELISPTPDNIYELPDNLPTLTYNVAEENNYTIKVYLNNNLLGYKPNNYILTEITTPGTYSLKVEAVDVAENIGSEIVEFTVIDSKTSSSKSSGFSLLITVLIMMSLTFIFRNPKKNR